MRFECCKGNDHFNFYLCWSAAIYRGENRHHQSPYIRRCIKFFCCLFDFYAIKTIRQVTKQTDNSTAHIHTQEIYQNDNDNNDIIIVNVFEISGRFHLTLTVLLKDFTLPYFSASKKNFCCHCDYYHENK